jgi:D-amino-acid dehydrogenase
MSKIAIIGAGITGVTTAYALLRRGFDVTVFERHRYPAMETSFANGGQLSASNAEVWNRPATMLHALQWMLRKDAPLLLNPKPSWHKYSWLAEFVAQSPRYKQNTLETLRLALAARAQLFEILEREKIQFDFIKRGILHVYKEKQEFEKAAAGNALLNKGGLERYAVTPSEMKNIEPALKGVFFGGYFTPDDAGGDIHKFTRELAAACVRQSAKFLYDASVDHIKLNDREIEIEYDVKAGEYAIRDKSLFNAVVICAGVESRKLAASLGDRVNIYPVKGYSISVYLEDQTSQEAAPQVSLLDDHRKVVTTRLGRDQFRVAGTAELNGFNRDIRSDRVKPLVDWTREHFPSVSTERIVSWSGLRPMTPNMLPRVGAGRRPCVFYNTGHGHLGWTLAAATADIVATEIGQAVRR